MTAWIPVRPLVAIALLSGVLYATPPAEAWAAPGGPTRPPVTW